MGAAKKLYEDFQDEKYLDLIKIEEEKRKEKQKKIATIKARRKRNRRRVLKATLCLAAIILVFNIQIRQEEITRLNLEVEELNAIINESNDELLALETKAQAKKSSIDIVNEAKTKLGMTFADEDQKIYYTVELEEEDSKQDQGIAKIYSIFTGKKD